MTIAEVARKLAFYLYNINENKSGEVYFDPSTYDGDDAKPYIRENGKIYIVKSANINKEGTTLEILLQTPMEDGCCGMDLCLIPIDEGQTEETIEKELEEMEIYNVLSEMFYYQSGSWDYDEFEDMLNEVQ